MQYKTIPFSPPIDKREPTTSAATALQEVISQQATEGWEFVGLQPHTTIVPGSNGCFGFGASPSYPDTLSLLVFKQ